MILYDIVYICIYIYIISISKFKVYQIITTYFIASSGLGGNREAKSIE